MPETAHGAASVVDGDTVRVDGVVGEVRLAGILAPKPRPGHEDLAIAAGLTREGLTALVKGHNVSVHPLPVAADRNGRIPAHLLIRDDGLWVQGELIRSGLARVAVNADTAMFASDMLALEDAARKAGRGLWLDPAFAVRDATDVQRLYKDTGSYQIVDGRIVTAARHGDILYLDFGADYHSDFAVMVPRTSWAAFSAAKLKPQTLAGKHVRVRGWITRQHGPAMEVTHPAMIEVLDGRLSLVPCRAYNGSP